MATYKKIVDVETVAEATENMNVLVEENGALKKVPSKEVGGGGEVIVFTCDNDDNFTCNKTYAETEELLRNYCRAIVMFTGENILCEMDCIYFSGDGYIQFNSGSDYMENSFNYHSDGSIGWTSIPS